mmetsp:Transcript_68003/g.76133  ORF Transcript_68003/g.76133 Transcript_68003/m.76133 type:complete len:462 (+) Transcript_68003:83-1468(+)
MKIKAERLLSVFLTIAVYIVWRSSNLIDNKAEGEHLATPHPPPHLHLHHDRRSDNNQKNNRNQHDNSKPYFVLHIGPPKTATTFIQCNLQILSKELANDFYYFVGKTCPGSKLKLNRMENNETGISGHYLIMGLNDAKTQNRGYEGLKSRMDYHLSKGNNIIYSNEAFANHLVDQNSTWECLQSMFTGWNVSVVIGYRHYFDWIRSFYYQINKQHAKLDKKWPNQGNGKAHPSFLGFLEYHLKRKEAGDLSVDGGHSNNAFGHHLTLTTYKKFSSHFDDIQILNLHEYEGEDIVTQFVCKMIPNAQNTCNRLKTFMAHNKDEKSPNLSKRPSQSFDAHRISEAAFELGYITKSSPKEVIVEKVKKRLLETGINNGSQSKFFVCPSQSLQARFLNMSITYENEMLAINHPNTEKNAKDAHISMYLRAEAEGRFCEIDPQTILKDEGWVNFLSKIGKETIKNK